MWPALGFVCLLFSAVYGGIENQDWDLAVAIEDQIELLTSNGTLIGTAMAFTKLKALTFDNIRHQFIVSDMKEQNDTIYVVSLTQEEIKNDPIIQDLPDDIQGLAVDPLNDTLYWSSRENKTINYISLADPNNNGVFMSFDDQNPQDLVIDSCRRYIYWTNSNLAKPSISRAKLGSAEHEVLIDYDLETPIGIAIDYVKGRLYWTDKKADINFKIESSDLDGKNRTVVVKRGYQTPYGLAVDEEAVYWTDTINNALWRLRKGHDIHPSKVRVFKERPQGLIAKHLGFMNTQDCSLIEKAIEEYPETVEEHFKHIDEKQEEYLLQNICLNNGEPSEDGCICTRGFKGPNCEINLCDNYCVHGSCYISGSGYPTCSCNEGYNGHRCENELCYNYCLNGGKCSYNMIEPQCSCPEGFVGERCEMSNNSLLAMCMAYCNDPRAATNSKENLTCNCDLYNQHTKMVEAHSEAQIEKTHPTASDYLRDPAFLILCICMFIITMIVVVLAAILLKMKRKRPRINKRIIVNKNVKPLAYRAQSSVDHCEITIENCCNMNLCETPCFEPPELKKTKKDEKKNLLKNMETGDDLY